MLAYLSVCLSCNSRHFLIGFMSEELPGHSDTFFSLNHFLTFAVWQGVELCWKMLQQWISSVTNSLSSNTFMYLPTFMVLFFGRKVTSITPLIRGYATQNFLSQSTLTWFTIRNTLKPSHYCILCDVNKKRQIT